MPTTSRRHSTTFALTLVALLLPAVTAIAEPMLVMQDMAPPLDAQAPPGQLRGMLQLRTPDALQLDVQRDDYGFAADRQLALDRLPDIQAAYLQVGGELVPLQRGLQSTAHPHWDLILEPGRIWRDSEGRDHFSLPFALQEKNANCTHNGVIRATLAGEGKPFPARVLIASETCLYFKFNLEGPAEGSFQRTALAGAERIASDHRRHRAARLPTRPLQQLPQPSALSGPGADLSAWGLVDGDSHYVSDCPTRRGPYPHCDNLSLPSYSLAKSLVAGLGLMRLEQRFPGSSEQTIASLVPECASAGHWRQTTLVDTLNMRTGHYHSAAAQADESSARMEEGFFLPLRHIDKLRFACRGWPARGQPGGQFVYHTSDTYLLGTAMTALLQKQHGAKADLYRDLLLPLWRQLDLSPALDTTRRTADTAAQPFAGYGLTLLRDDIARIGQALNRDTLAPQLDRRLLLQALQRDPAARGYHPAEADELYYQHGFWGFDATRLLSCPGQLVIPFLSGYGGINVLLLPDDRIYYYFSDGGQFAFTDALRWLHRQRDLCPTTTSPNPGTSS
ncbi:serine hydrolase [Parahaliea aestuarii]|uniref:Beta-lactamase family protein n=1 Tax=Parahaliea aestuarii TaxID=1852021 RepID=A0A5C9A0H1_9GAMM|nr:serine hydrolase [Parahaliea aestuarii]TXS94363.1 beta-lactamase family protein [Parahaliea aestuarii]